MYQTQSPGAFLDTISPEHFYSTPQRTHPKVKLDKAEGHLEPHSLPLAASVPDFVKHPCSCLTLCLQIQSKQGSNG